MSRRLAHCVPLLALVAALGLQAAATAQVLPTGGTVTQGSVTINQPSATSLVINQASAAGIINWSTFSIGTGNQVQFNNGTGATLNRVTGNVPSSINGLLTATGSVYLVNPAGVAVGAGGIVRTGGSFVASTLDVKDADFLAGGSMTFDGASTAAVVNLGRIGSARGDVVLIARTVQNDGSIVAPQGTAAMASGREVVLSDGSLGNGKVSIKVAGTNGQVVNRGSIRAANVELRANGGNVFALAGNTNGVIKATGVANKGGRIFLTAEGGSVVATQRIEARRVAAIDPTAPRGSRVKGPSTGGDILIEADAVTIGGVLDASGTGGAGGRIVVTGGNVTLASGALLDASGTTGGLVLVGGDRAGGSTASTNFYDRAVRNADTVTIESGAAIKADGTTGSGGNVVVWSQQQTSFAGTISARGSDTGGDGGFAEVSSHGLLNYAGTTDLRAPAGRTGTLLLDPYDILISSSSDTAVTGSSPFTPTGNTSVLNVATLENALATANVVVTTGGAGSPGAQAGNITVDAVITWSSANTLTLSAYNNVTFNYYARAINTGGGSLIIRADNSGTGVGTVNFIYYMGPTVDFSGSTGTVSIYYNPLSYASPSTFTANVATAYSGQLTSYMLVNNASDLANISTNLSGTYALGRDFSAATFAGFSPGTAFSGTLDGNGGLGVNHTISNLGLAGSGTFGLFPIITASGTVRNLTLSDVSITATGANATMGAVAGINYGTIRNVTVTGTVDGGGFGGVWAGGIAGLNGGVIVDTTAVVSVATGASGRSGGLVGFNTSSGTIVGSTAWGFVGSGTQGEAGGLVGRNDGEVIGSSAYAGVSVGVDGDAGGLVGYNTSSGAIVWSSAYGIVSSAAYGTAGGLVGYNSGEVFWSSAAGAVSVGYSGDAGGLVGFNASSGVIVSSSASGLVSSAAWGTAGGLVGTNNGEILHSSASGAVSVGLSGDAGGLVGFNGIHGTIIGGYAIGTVDAADDSTAGGLVGTNAGLVVDAHTTSVVTGGSDSAIGGLVGWNSGTLQNVWAIGTAETTGTNSAVGGLVGFNVGDIDHAFADVDVSGGSGTALGGLVGVNATVTGYPAATITDSYAVGAVTGDGTAVVGGLVGINGGIIDQTYATGAVTTGAGGTAGGLVGRNTISAGSPVATTLNNYIVTGGGTVTSSYWDPLSTGQTTSSAGTPYTTAQFAQGLPPGFDPAVWRTFTGQTYPYLSGTPYAFLLGDWIGALTTDILAPVVPASLIADPNAGGPPVPTRNNITAPQNNTGPGTGGAGGRGGPGNPGAGPPPGPGIDRSPSEQQFSGVPPISETRFIPNEIVLQIPASVTRAQIEAIARMLGVEIVSADPINITSRTVYRFKMKAGQDIRALIRTLEQNRIVSSAQPNYVYGLAQAAPAPVPTPAATDPAAPPAATGPEPAASGSSDLASDLAARTTLPTGDPAQYVIQKLQLGAVHQRVRGANITVAVIDSEIDLRHPDLQGVLVERFDATGSPSKPHTHGTGMAGAIASRFRLLGVAPGVRLLAVRAFSETNTSAEATTAQVLKGLDWVLTKSPRIINMSFAGPRDLMTERVLEAASRQGIVLIAAAGNAGPKSPPLYPAADPNVIAVSATDNDDKPFAMANRGKHIAIAAPGVDVLVPSPDGAYQLTTGTSVAAAHVSGVAALLLEARPTLTPAEVRAILIKTAKPLGPGKDLQTGAGLIDPIRSLSSLGPATSAAPPVIPPAAPIRPGVVPAQPLR
ncbi:MAG: S8 family serine peptidase [Rhodoplanes sp.]|uniref:S8 family serine peptidase n=1 Tax=Rhodoplanes sp. TaxID=1968906 RepID=UPI0017AC2166|nr:S8 family serine peptidase [Rhodoplanes sp.]NVO13666.1 S8 family serine peptidase [Rhodoplanes sp.]